MTFDLRLVGLHVAIAIVILVIYLAKRTPANRRAWLASLANYGQRLQRLEDCKDAEILYAQTLDKQLEAARKEIGALRFELRVVTADRNTLLVKNLELQRDVDDCKAEK